MRDKRDHLFAKSRIITTEFRFDEQVVKVFPDMISRSVPGYELVIPMIAMLARRYAQDDSNIYDLGCSLGAASLAMSHSVKAQGAEVIAVDNSEAMVKRCRQGLEDNCGPTGVKVRLENLLDTSVENASVVVLNFTLQFLDPGQRQELVNRISTGMRTGGALILSEKICFTTPREQEDQVMWHHDFKRTQGYSDLEIAQKRNALEAVLIPDTEQQHLERFSRAGLTRSRRWFQCFNFVSYISFR